MKNTLIAFALTVALGISGAGSSVGVHAVEVMPRVAAPTPGAPVSYQLGGAYEPENPAGTVIRDRTEHPAPGYYNICYINGFQTQTDETHWWKQKHPSLLLRKNGRVVMDRQWNEALLDTSTAAKRRALTRIVGLWIDGCARKGFAAVEFDNLDSYLRSRGRLSKSNSLAFAKRLVARAHSRGLAAGQKNATELGSRGKRIAKFDFAVAEDCERYRECGAYTAVYGNRLIEVEYTDSPRRVFDRACQLRGATISVVLRDRLLRTPSHPGYRSQTC